MEVSHFVYSLFAAPRKLKRVSFSHNEIDSEGRIEHRNELDTPRWSMESIEQRQLDDERDSIGKARLEGVNLDLQDKNAERGPQQVFEDYWKESKKAREYAQLLDKPLHAIGQERGRRMKQIRNEQRNAADELYEDMWAYEETLASRIDDLERQTLYTGHDLRIAQLDTRITRVEAYLNILD